MATGWRGLVVAVHRCIVHRDVLKDVGIKDLRMVNSTSASLPATAPQPAKHSELKVLGGQSSRRSDIYSSLGPPSAGKTCVLEDLWLSL